MEKHGQKSKFFEKLRQRQERQLKIDKYLREFDIQDIKSKGVQIAKFNLKNIETDWKDSQKKIKDNIGFLRGMKSKNEEEIKSYKEIEDLF